MIIKYGCFTIENQNLNWKKNHKRKLVVFSEYEKNYTTHLAGKDGINFHQKHFHFLATELFKSKNKLNTEFIRSFWENDKISYSLKCSSIVNLLGTNGTKSGIKSINFRGAKVVEHNTKKHKAFKDAART